MEQNQRTKKIFIVSDDKLLLDMYTLKFKDEGFDVLPGYGSVDGLEKLRGGITFDAILLDVTAPMLDSLDLLTIIRDERLITDAKVIILSNATQLGSEDKSHVLGVNSYISKVSNTPSQVVDRVASILNTTTVSA